MSDDPGGSSSTNSSCPGGPNIGNNNNNNNNIRANDHKSKASLLQQLLSADWMSRWHFLPLLPVHPMHNVILSTCAVDNWIRYSATLDCTLLAIHRSMCLLIYFVRSHHLNEHLSSLTITKYLSIVSKSSPVIFNSFCTALAERFSFLSLPPLPLLLLLLLQSSTGMVKWEVRKNKHMKTKYHETIYSWYWYYLHVHSHQLVNGPVISVIFYLGMCHRWTSLSLSLSPAHPMCTLRASTDADGFFPFFFFFFFFLLSRHKIHKSLMNWLAILITWKRKINKKQELTCSPPKPSVSC